MNVFGIGLPEMALIMVIALLIFGPKKLPEIGRSLGKALKGFQDASKEFENEFKREADQLKNTLNDTPMEATLEQPPKLTEAQGTTVSPASDSMDASAAEAPTSETVES